MRFNRLRDVLLVTVGALILSPAALRAQKDSPSTVADQCASHKEPAKFRARTVKVFFAYGKVLVNRRGAVGDEEARAEAPIQEGFKTHQPRP